MDLFVKPTRITGKYSYNVTNEDLNKIVLEINLLQERLKELENIIVNLNRIEVLPEKTKKTKKQ